ncbi:MAG: hypothetical protein WC756_12060 [Taibaiella sp.]|jgi:hypothetical protein
MAGNQGNNRIIWKQWQIDFLIENFSTMTAQQLSDSIGIKRTKVRMKYAELGLKKLDLEYWTDEQLDFLKSSYQTMGDVEIAEVLNERWPKNKQWTKNHIAKKRNYLKLKRSPEQQRIIIKNNSIKGGRSYTIDKNSSSKNMHPRWVAQQIAWRNPELQMELIKHPQIINAAKASILLKRTVKQLKNDTKGNS